MAQAKKFPKKFIVIPVLLLALAGGGFWGWQKMRGAEKSGPAFTIASVETGNIEDVVTAQGTLEPRDYVDVGAQVSGQLDKVHVEIGDTVKEGDLLAEIDPEIYESRVKADEARLKTLNAQLAEQQAQVKLAWQKAERNARLIKLKAVSQDLYEDTQTALIVAQAQLQSVEAQLEEAQSTLEGDKASLSYTTIYAPMAGTVVLQSAQEGQTLNASQSAPVIVQLANLDRMTVRAQVAEADVMRLKEQMPVYFTTLGSQERKWNGVVRQILPSPEIVNDVVLYNVLVDVDNTDRRLMTGMSTQMFFVVGKAENVPVIPVAALGKRVAKEDNEQGQAYQIRVARGKTQEERVVHIGLMDRTLAEVRSGLAIGDQVAIATPQLNPSQQGGSGRGMGRGMGPRI